MSSEKTVIKKSSKKGSFRTVTEKAVPERLSELRPLIEETCKLIAGLNYKQGLIKLNETLDYVSVFKRG